MSTQHFDEMHGAGDAVRDHYRSLCALAGRAAAAT